ncbi:MAG: WD40 repeat domain-containing protein [Mycobacteriales bacterium]
MDAVSVTPDGRIIATGSSSGEIVFYNSQSWTTSGKPVQTGMGVIHQAMTFTPNGRYLVVAAHSDTSASVLLIDAKTHRVVRKLAWTKSIPPYLAVSPDGRQLAVLLPTYSNNTLAAVRTRIDLYALPTLRRQGLLRYPNGTGGDLEQVAYVGNNRLVASDMDPIKYLGGAVVPAPTTMLFDARTGRLLRTFPNGGVIAAAPDDRTVAIGTDDDEAGSSGRVLLLDVRTGHERALTSASGLGSAYSLAFSPDGKTLLSGDDQSTLRRWDTATGTLTGTFTGDGGLVDDIRFAPDGATAYTGGSDGGVLAWDLGGRQQLGQTLTWGTANDACWATCFAVNPTETLMATNEFGIHRMQLIDPRSFTALRTVKLSDRSEQDGLDFSPDGQTLATTGRAGLVTFWRAPAVTPYAHLRLSGPGDFVKFAPDGKLLATESDLGLHGATVTLWTWPSLRRMRSWNITGDASGMAFSPDGSTLMTVTQVPAGGGLQLRDVATGKELRVPSTDQAITHAAFSPDDRTLAIGLYDGSLLFWDLQRHRLVGAPLRIGSVGIGSLAFSPTGRLLAVGTLDAVQTIWDVRARSQIGAPLPSPSGQTSVTQFLRNGDLIDEYNGNAIKWPTSANAWAAFACEVAGRDMTRAEWHDLLPNRPYQHVCPG